MPSEKAEQRVGFERRHSLDAVTEAAQLLKPGGHLIGSVAVEPALSGSPDPGGDPGARIRAQLAPLRCSEVVLAVEERGSWRVVTDGTGGKGVAPSAEAMALFVAERP